MAHPVRPPTPAPWSERSPLPNASPSSPRLPSPLGGVNTRFWFPNKIVWIHLIFKSANAMARFMKEGGTSLKDKATLSEPFLAQNTPRCCLRIASTFDDLEETCIDLFKIYPNLGPYLYKAIKRDL